MEQIFVQIASYRDVDLPNTIKSALENSACPERIRFGICWQYDDHTYTDLDAFATDPRFRIASYYYEDSGGCCWARNQTNRLYEGEDYTLQIDAHTRFSPKWDTRYLRMIRSVDSSKPLLTTYPAPFETINGKDNLTRDRGIQRLKLNRIRKDLTTDLRTEIVEADDHCVQSRFIAAGQIFTLGRFCEEVEYDPHLYFAGEEINLAARGFTHGYDFYCPNKDVIWHRYKHKMRNHWDDHKADSHEIAIDRLKTLLVGDHRSLGKYGLGQERSLSDFERYVDIDFSERIRRKPTPMRFRKTVHLDVSKIEDRDDYVYWIFTLKNIDEKEIFRHDIHDKMILSKAMQSIEVDEYLEDEPVSYMIWPYVKNQGYLDQHHRDL